MKPVADDQKKKKRWKDFLKFLGSLIFKSF
jgi:hypothetical protein